MLGNPLNPGTLSFTNDSELLTDTVVDVRSDVRLFGALNGARRLTKTGNGKLTLAGGSSAYSGGTVLDQGTLVVADAGALGSGSLAIGGGVTLDMSALDPNISVPAGSISVGGDFTFISNGMNLANAVKLTADSTVNVVGGSLILENVPGAFLFGKTGPGTLVLKGSNAIVGPVNVAGGTLILDGLGAILSSVNVAEGAFVFAKNGAQVNSFSGDGTLIKPSQTITFDQALGSKVYGDGPVALNAFSSSGMPVSYRVLDGPGAISGGSVVLTGAGTITIQAEQLGSGSFAAAAPVQRSVSVNRRSVGLNGLSAQNRVYDATTNATIAGTPSLIAGGTINGDVVSVGGTAMAPLTLPP
ncbi:MAG: hypothetical protein EBS01_07680 [Verrucomicrobia bacterium]|nr:hypothetical protein [Verrucomicrobiota bacterium]